VLLLLYLGCTTNHRSIPFGYLLHLLVQHHQVFSGVFIPKEVDGVGDKESRDTIMVDVQTPLEAIFIMPPPPTADLMPSSGKKQNFWS
jgi:hypothetical protein